MWITLGLPYVGFNQLLESVGLHLLPNWGNFRHYFFKSTFFLCSETVVTWILNLLLMFPRPLRYSSFNFWFIFTLIFRLSNFYHSIFSFTDSFPVISILFCFFGCATCGILVPWPGIKPLPLTVEAQSLNHWTAREVPLFFCWAHVVSLFWLLYFSVPKCPFSALFSEINFSFVSNFYTGCFKILVRKPTSKASQCWYLVPFFLIHDMIFLVLKWTSTAIMDILEILRLWILFTLF